MNHFRCAPALLLSLAMMCTVSTASAASNDFASAPVLKFDSTDDISIESGSFSSIDINATLPGFLNLYLTDASGSTVLNIAEHQEIHSNLSSIDFRAIDDNGDPLDPGTYTLCADMVSQYGVASKVVLQAIKVEPDPDAKPAASTAEASSSGSSTTNSTTSNTTNSTTSSTTNSTTSSTASSTTSSTTNSTASSTASSSQTVSKASASASSSSASIEYEAGQYVMGDDGLMIGVGVPDAADQDDAGYWTLSADADDAAIWAALERPLISVDVGENESAYIYDSTKEGRKRLGTLSGTSQGVNLIKKRSDGWALVEAYRNEDGAFVRGYIRSNKLRSITPNPNYGIVIDKATQTLTVYKSGQRLGSCQVSTGLATTKFPHRETPAGEFVLVTRRGTYEYYGMGYTRYTIRLNGNYYLCEVPTAKKNGNDFLDLPAPLGEKATRGNICVTNEASTDGGINAEWIWNMTTDNKKVKVLILDDKPRTDVPVSEK